MIGSGSRPGILLAVLIFGFFGMGCAFMNQVVDRSAFDRSELVFDDILPDRDLPDITVTIVRNSGSGAGGGAVGGCWSCG